LKEFWGYPQKSWSALKQSVDSSSYAKAFPFNKTVDGMMNPEMIDDTIQIIMEGIRRRKRMNLIINNRAGGSAPMIAQQIAKRLQEVIL
jgi:hypothetical protein